jgi:hypothetical protein
MVVVAPFDFRIRRLQPNSRAMSLKGFNEKAICLLRFTLYPPPNIKPPPLPLVRAR